MVGDGLIVLGLAEGHIESVGSYRSALSAKRGMVGGTSNSLALVSGLAGL